MATTRATVELILVRRVGRSLVAADLDGTTVDGSNPDLNDPIGWAARQAGLSVADVANVADSDLAALAVDDTDKLLDLAELRALDTILENVLDLVDTKEGPLDQKLSQLGSRMETAIVRKRAQIMRDYGIGVGSLGNGVINLGFQQRPVCGVQIPLDALDCLL